MMTLQTQKGARRKKNTCNLDAKPFTINTLIPFPPKLSVMLEKLETVRTQGEGGRHQNPATQAPNLRSLRSKLPEP